MSDWRARAVLWLADTQHDWWVYRGNVAEAIGTVQIHLVERPGKWLLCRLFGHKPIADQCGIPDHDYCVWCDKPTPGAALRGDT